MPVHRSSVCIGGLEQGGNVGGEELDGDGEEDDAEELAEDVDPSLAEDSFCNVEVSEYEIDDDHVEQYRHDDVLDVVLGPQGQDGGEGSGSGYEREDDGHDGGGASWPLVFEYLYIQNHLAGQYEDDDRAGYGKRLDIYAEEGQYGVSKEQKQQEYDG